MLAGSVELLITILSALIFCYLRGPDFYGLYPIEKSCMKPCKEITNKICDLFIIIINFGLCMCFHLFGLLISASSNSLSLTQAVPQLDFEPLQRILASNKKFKWISNRISTHWRGWVAGHKMKARETPANFTKRNVRWACDHGCK